MDTEVNYMDKDETPQDDPELCSLAMDEALKMCQGNDHMFRNFATFMGFSEDEFKMVTPLDDTYKELILDGEKNGIDEITIRPFVLAKAYEYVKVKNMDAVSAFTEAWADARKMRARETKTPDTA